MGTPHWEYLNAILANAIKSNTLAEETLFDTGPAVHPPPREDWVAKWMRKTNQDLTSAVVWFYDCIAMLAKKEFTEWWKNGYASS